jgi:tRNA G18 (ribose-2'-O)-methylase SpoU
LNEDGVETFAIEQAKNSVFLDEFSPKKGVKIALVMGNEVNGVQQEVIDACKGVIEVPQIGTKHSLNISVCTGIVVWDIFSKIKNNVH